MKARISLGSRIRAGPAGSVDWRRATRPPGSFLASRQSPPLEPLQGLAHPSAPRSVAGMPLRMFMVRSPSRSCGGFPGVLAGGGLGADAVQGLDVDGGLLWLVDVVGAGHRFAVDDA